MKWFKHLVDSRSDPYIGELIVHFGFAGPYMFWTTLEIMGKEFDIEDPGCNKFSFKWFLSQFFGGIGRKKFQDFLDFSVKKGRFFYNLDGDLLIIKCPKFKDLCDDYTAKQARGKPEVTPNKIRNKSVPKNQNKNKNKDKTSKKKSPPELKFGDSHFELAKALKQEINARMPKYVIRGDGYLDQWANEFRIMEEKKEATAEEIANVISWLWKEDFWYQQIRSAANLRKHFGVLWEKQKGGGRQEYQPSDIALMNRWREKGKSKGNPEYDKARADFVRGYRKEHPDAAEIDEANAIGVFSRNWWKQKEGEA